MATILVIDDDKIVREAVTDILEIFHVNVLSASDGTEGIEVFAENLDVIDGIIIDRRMPKLNGLATLQKLRAIQKDIPVIMITSRATDKHRQLADEAGVSEYLNKPYSEEQLLQCIHSHLQQAGH